MNKSSEAFLLKIGTFRVLNCDMIKNFWEIGGSSSIHDPHLILWLQNFQKKKENWKNYKKKLENLRISYDHSL